MPYLTIVVPQIPAEAKDLFLASWPKIAESMKGQPELKGLSGGLIVAADGQAVTDFQYLQLFAFETLENEAAFFSSDLIKTLQASKGADSVESVKATFQTSEFPQNVAPKKLVQFSRITFADGKKEELREAWAELATAVGQEVWGGISLGDGPSVGLGLLGWDNLEETKAAFQDPKAAAALQKWRSLGESKNVIAELTRY